jgi:hypothetical protein
MRNSIAGLFVALAVTAGTAAPANAQVGWDAPLMVSPEMPGGFGIFLIDAAGGRLGALGTWRASGTPGLGFRIGIAEQRRGPNDNRMSAFGGVDVSGNLVRASDDFPLHMLWVMGAGLGIGDNALLSFPFGVSLGRSFAAEDVVFNPYIAPRLVLDAIMGSDIDSDMDLGFVVDLGTDIAFAPGWAIRFGASVGDREALAIGLSFGR